MKILCNSKKNLYCCFCKHYYDPCNKSLTPRNVKEMFLIDSDFKSKCTLTGLEMRSISVCKKFERK